MMKNFSLKMRLTVYFVFASCFIWGAAAGVAWHEIKDNIDEFFDTYQMALARQLTATDWQKLTAVQKQTNELIGSIKNADDEDEAVAFAVFDAKGQNVFNDNEAGKKILFAPVLGAFVEQKVDGDLWRIVWLNSVDGKFVVAVGQELEFRHDIIWDTMEEFMLPLGIGLLLLLGMIVFILTMEFAPLGGLVKSLKTRKRGDLSPLGYAGLPKEISPLIEAINALFAQIDEMMAKERSFISNSAHELRTPLTALKVQLEVAEMSKNDEKAIEISLSKIAQGVDRASRLVEQLLTLSKVNSSKTIVKELDEDINWNEVVNALCDEYANEMSNKNMLMKTEVISDVAPITTGNKILCHLMLRNLVENAIKYTKDNQQIAIMVKNGEIEVFNSGVRVDEKHLAKLGMAFYRPSGQNEKGSGLGLSIVSSIAAIYDCDVIFENVDDGFRVRIVKKQS